MSSDFQGSPLGGSSRDPGHTEPEACRLLIATFDTQPAAKGALGALAVAHAEWLHVAEIRRDEAGALTIRETAGMSTARAAVAGGLAGALVGMISRRPGQVAVLGTLVGAGLNAIFDVGIPDPMLRAIGEGLPPDTSSLVVVVDATWVERVGALVERRGGIYRVEPWETGARVVRPRWKPLSLAEFMRRTQGGVQSGAGEMQQVLASATAQGRALVRRVRTLAAARADDIAAAAHQATGPAFPAGRGGSMADTVDAINGSDSHRPFAAGAGSVDGGTVGDGLSARDITALSPEQATRSDSMGSEGREIPGSQAGEGQDAAAPSPASGAGNEVGWVNSSRDVEQEGENPHEVQGALHIGSTGGYEGLPRQSEGAGSGSVGYGVENEAEWGTPEIRRQSQVAQEQGGRWAEDPVWEPGSPSEESTMVMHSVENVYGEAVINPTPVRNTHEEGIMAEQHTEQHTEQHDETQQGSQMGGQNDWQIEQEQRGRQGAEFSGRSHKGGQQGGRMHDEAQGEDDAAQMSTRSNDEKSIYGDASASTPTTSSAAASDPYNDQKPGENVDDAFKND
jgi:uncharacterized membrane protein